jgi:RelA/SpoT family (p)ppGpp synthetase
MKKNPKDETAKTPTRHPSDSQVVHKISHVCEALQAYLEPEAIDRVYRAYLFSAEAHKEQRRYSGDLYIHHPIAVAQVLANMHMDAESIIAALLHDVLEDTLVSKQTIADQFGKQVADLVDGVTKLTKIPFESRDIAQAENFRKMVLAMADDIRVIIIKLADRLHNMRTLQSMPLDKRRRIAKETLEIYAPIANRLGINSLRVELEDLCLEAIYPMRSRVLKERVKKARGNRSEIVNKIRLSLATRLAEEGIEADVVGREKHLFSIYNKMQSKTLSFNDILDVFAFRIIVKDVDTCYRSLGTAHNLYKPVPGRFKDYVAIPKANGYQSLHTVLFGPRGVPIEIQIRSKDMQRVADSGVAAHWLYKDSENSPANSAHSRAREWIRGLLEMQKSAGSSLEFIENVKIDLFPEEIYIFTPKGDIIELPRGSTPVDFAYAVHSQIGDSCLAAKVDRRLVPLRTQLDTGQTVEIISAPGAKPNAAWLDFVVSAKARASIRHHLKKLKHEDAIALGRRLLDKALTSFELEFDALEQSRLLEILNSLNLKSLDDLLESIGLGRIMPILIAKRLSNTPVSDHPTIQQERRRSTRGVPLLIKGTEGMVVSFGKCCQPIPGDQIVGFISSGKGIVIHRRGCRNVAEFLRNPEKWVDVQWGEHLEREFSATIRIDVKNQRGVLGAIAASISDQNANIENVQVEERENEGMVATLQFTVSVRNRHHLAQVMRRLRSLSNVIRISRVGG